MALCILLGLVLMLIVPAGADFSSELMKGYLIYILLVIIRHFIAWRRNESGGDYLVYNSLSVAFPFLAMWTIYLFGNIAKFWRWH